MHRPSRMPQQALIARSCAPWFGSTGRRPSMSTRVVATTPFARQSTLGTRALSTLLRWHHWLATTAIFTTISTRRCKDAHPHLLSQRSRSLNSVWRNGDTHTHTHTHTHIEAHAVIDRISPGRLNPAYGYTPSQRQLVTRSLVCFPCTTRSTSCVVWCPGSLIRSRRRTPHNALACDPCRLPSRMQVSLPLSLSLSLSLARARSKSHCRAADAVRCCVDVALEKLPSRCESFFIFVPHSGVFRHLVRRRNLFNLPLIVEAFH